MALQTTFATLPEDIGAVANAQLFSPMQMAPLPGCNCPACMALAAQLAHAGQGGTTPGSFATTPTGDAWTYVGGVSNPTQGGGDIAALMAGSKWTSLDAQTSKTVITYSFADPATSSYAYSDYSSTLTAFSSADKQMVRDVLAKIAAVANVQFVEVPDDATQCGVVRYGYSQQVAAMNFAGYAYFPSSDALGGDVWINPAMAAAQWNGYRPDLFLHETLHAIGLKHPFDNGATLDAADNIIPNTVMSYSPVPGASNGSLSAYPAAPMSMDIDALQYLYGGNAATNAGNTVYDLSSPAFQNNFQAVWDAGGSDSFDASAVAHGVTLDLTPGALSNVGLTVRAMGLVNGATVNSTYTSTVSISSTTVIENAVGSNFDDHLAGNDGTNWLVGNAGNDVLEGRGGNDAIDGGAGIDTAVYAASRAGYSIARTAGGYTVTGGTTGADALVNVERVAFSDAHIALDLDGNAGAVARVLGAVMGADAVHNAQFVGAGLRQVDAGVGEQAFAQMELDARLGAHPTNQAVVDLLYTNVCGVAPDAATEAYYVGQLASGAYTQASIAVFAADCQPNQDHIGLVGLAAHGLDYAA